MLYTLKAYLTRKQGESGKHSPDYESKTGSLKTAYLVAQSLANEYGACVLVNNGTGKRVWFLRK